MPGPLNHQTLAKILRQADSATEIARIATETSRMGIGSGGGGDTGGGASVGYDVANYTLLETAQLHNDALAHEFTIPFTHTRFLVVLELNELVEDGVLSTDGSNAPHTQLGFKVYQPDGVNAKTFGAYTVVRADVAGNIEYQLLLTVLEFSLMNLGSTKGRLLNITGGPQVELKADGTQDGNYYELLYNYGSRVYQAPPKFGFALSHANPELPAFGAGTYLSVKLYGVA